MPIPVECERCNATFQVAEEHAGKRAKCGRCGKVVSIPELFEPEVHEPEVVDADFPFAGAAAPSMNSIIDEDEEYAIAAAPSRPPDPAPSRAPEDPSFHAGPPGDKSTDMRVLTVRRPRVMLVVVGLCAIVLLILPVAMAPNNLEDAEDVFTLWGLSIALVTLLAAPFFLCRERYAVSNSASGNPQLAVETYSLFGQRMSREVRNLNDFESIVRVEFESKMRTANGCLVFFFLGLPAFLLYYISTLDRHHEVVFRVHEGRAGEFTATFAKPDQASELIKIVRSVANLSVVRTSDLLGS